MIVKYRYVVTYMYSKLYPSELRNYPVNPPKKLYWLYLNFNPNEKPIVAVVGSRRCSNYGRYLAYEVGKIVARLGAVLCTGLAEGVDYEASLGALERGGYVIGVRPWLRPLTLPKESRQLLRFLGRGLAIASDVLVKPSDMYSIMKLYCLRNRIIAGMSRLIIVIEPRLGGGSMHMIEYGLRAGKIVLVLEPSRGTKHYEAYIEYVRNGAVPVQNLDELREILQTGQLR